MDRLRLFQNLVAAAAIDGDIADEERRALAWFGTGLGIGEADFVASIAMAADFKLVVPKDAKEREAALEMVARILRADGKVTGRERGLFLAFGRRMGVADAELEERLRYKPGPKEHS